MFSGPNDFSIVDYFAAQALVGLVAVHVRDYGVGPSAAEDLAKKAYAIGRAMDAERAKLQGPKVS